MKRPVLATSEGRQKYRKAIVDACKLRQQRKAQQAELQKQAEVARIQQGRGCKCPTAGCTRIFLTKGALGEHLKKNACTSGVNPFRKGKRKAEAYTSFEDKRRRLLADSGISSKVKEVTPSADGQGDDTPVEKLQSTGTYELISGGMFTVATLTRGFACKVAKRSNRVYELLPHKTF